MVDFTVSCCCLSPWLHLLRWCYTDYIWLFLMKDQHWPLTTQYRNTKSLLSSPSKFSKWIFCNHVIEAYKRVYGYMFAWLTCELAYINQVWWLLHANTQAPARLFAPSTWIVSAVNPNLILKTFIHKPMGDVMHHCFSTVWCICKTEDTAVTCRLGVHSVQTGSQWRTTDFLFVLTKA